MYLTIKKTILASKFGLMLVATTGKDAIFQLHFGREQDELEAYFYNKYAKDLDSGDMRVSSDIDREISIKVCDAVDKGTIHNLGLHLMGSPFQRAVWNIIYAIPCGSTISYKDIANRIGNPNAVRAIGTACGANPIPVIVPCHRVIKTNGDMGNYHYGSEMKRFLLKREGVSI